MRGDPEALYAAHATRLYAYCWTLVGEDAPAALRDTYVAAMQHPPRGDAVLWLYALARSACRDRGALDGAFGRALHPAHATDPLMRVAAGLRADHREVLVLAAGEWLGVPDIATVLGIAPDTVRQLLQTAAVRLERGVLDTLMREPGSSSDAEVIAAFEKGALPRLLARRVPDRPPPALHAEVMAACAAELDRPLSTMAPSSPLVVIGDAARTRESRRKAKGMGVVAGIAASVAAAAGLVAAWTSTKDGGDGLNALTPGAGHGSKMSSSSDVPQTGPDTNTHPVRPATGDPADADPQTRPDGPQAGPPESRQPGPRTSAPTGDPSSPRSRTPGPKPSPTDPPSKPPETPSDPPSETPTDPPTTPPDPDPSPTDPPTQSPEPSPNPTTGPSPSPSPSG